MNWDYVAGLFDGEGSIGFSRVGPYSFELQIIFTVGSSRIRQNLLSFLRDNAYTPCTVSPTGPYYTFGTNKTYMNPYRIHIYRWDECARIITELTPRVYDKERNLAIAKRIIELRSHALANKETISSHLAEFDVLRRELHKLSRKGRRTLKPWNPMERKQP